MGERALSSAPEETDMAHRRTEGVRVDSPAIRLLDALRTGDDVGVLAVCSDNTVVSAENMRWSCQGHDDIQRWLVEARERFPGLTFESRTRHIGFGLVIDEARVQDAEPDDLAPAVRLADAQEHETRPDAGSEVDGSDHPMWDQPVTVEPVVTQVWGVRTEEEQPPTALNMPVRVTVRHDDLQVHEVSFSFPAALLKRALGLKVDPLEMSLSEVQSAFIAPVGAGFTTYALDRPELTLVQSPPDDEPAPDRGAAGPPRRRRRGRVLLLLLLVLVLLGTGGWWWSTHAGNGRSTAGQPTPSPSVSVSVSPSPSASVSPSQTTRPSVTTGQPTNRPSAKPNITLKSDLAFGINSAALSTKAKAEIADLAAQIRRAGLTGTIYVDGYTDSLGSAASGKVLSQRRAQVVAEYLTSHLGTTDVTVVATGYGEAHPIESNTTASGRQANRRVTITLPKG